MRLKSRNFRYLMKTTTTVVSNISFYFAFDLKRTVAFNDRRSLKNNLWTSDAILVVSQAFHFWSTQKSHLLHYVYSVV